LFAYIKGKVTTLSPFQLIIENNGIGYQVEIPLYVYDQIKPIENEITIYTRVIYREDSRKIYGFLSPEEVRLFDFFLSLPGFGPSIVLNIFSYYTINELIGQLESGNKEAFQKIPGIGGTKATKLVFEATQKKKKLLNIKMLINKNDPTSPPPSIDQPDSVDEVTETIFAALETLGYNRKDIEKAELRLQSKEKELPAKEQNQIETWIRLFMQYL